MKPIRLSNHAKEQIARRGVTEEEIIETIKTSLWQYAEVGRLECRRDFAFENEWNKKHYKIKQVRPNILTTFKGDVKMRITYD